MKSLKEVDWSIAPEGATHYNEDCTCPWLKESPPSYFVENKGVWAEYTTGRQNYEYHFNKAVKRPQVWDDSSGMPPVGTVCEYYHKGGDEWRGCEIVAHYSANAVAIDLLSFTAVFEHPTMFRPIKTPEQIAAEERLIAIDEMVDLAIGYSSIFKDAMAKLYDTGYRKTEVKK